MASKQPFKVFNIAQKLTTWSIRINKFFKHRLLSKRKHVLIISNQQPNNINQIKNLYIIDKQQPQLIKLTKQLLPTDKLPNQQQINFQNILLKNLYKTWEITQLKSITQIYQQSGLLNNQKHSQKSTDSSQIKDNAKNSKVQTIQQTQNQEQPSNIVITNFSNKHSIQTLQKHWTTKKKYFDSIIIMPQKEQPHLYPQIKDQAFATTFINTLEEKLLKNMTAYRFAHKFLNTSGTFIQSTSQYDFLKKTDQEKKTQQQKKIDSKSDKKQQDTFCYAQKRPSSSKQIIDNTICYLGVVIGDRDHTDLNSWTLVSLGEQASWKNPTYVGKMYYDWADGQHLPMPGSLALFKKKIISNGSKEIDFIEYL